MRKFFLLASMVALMPAGVQALTLDEMNEPGSAFDWRESRPDARAADVSQYLYRQHKVASVEVIRHMEKCIERKLDAYDDDNLLDTDGPALTDLMEVCTQ